MRRLLMGIVLVLVLVGVCATLEQSVSPDGTATQTETIVTEAVNEFKDILQGMADEFKSIFFSSEGKTENSETTEIDAIAKDDLPEDVREIYEKYKQAGWIGNVSGQSKKTKAGGTWKNKTGSLPEISSDGNPITYKEFDLDNVEEDGQRSSRRFVHGSDGKTYYTDDHYGTFTEIIE